MELQRKQNKQGGDKKYDLPEPIIHKILSVLETKDAGKLGFYQKLGNVHWLHSLVFTWMKVILMQKALNIPIIIH